MSEPQIEVTVQWPNHPERRVMLGAGITHLGRAEENELVLPDAGVSRKHARIRIEGTQIAIEDLGSGNGVWFRGNRVDRMDLKDGDQVYIDPFTLTFRVAGRAKAMVINVPTAAPAPAPVVAAPPAAPPPAPSQAPAQRAAAQPTVQRPIPQPQAAQPPAPVAAPSAVRPRGQLTTLSGPKLQAIYALRDPTTTMGRSNQRDIILFDPASSRLQAEITIQDGGFWLKDGGSANGTFLNGEPARSHPLKDGDRIRIGGTEFRFDSLPTGGVSADPELPPTRARTAPPAGATAIDEPIWDRRTQVLPPAALPQAPASTGGGQRWLLAVMVLIVLGGLGLSGVFFLLALNKGGGLDRVRQALYTQADPLPPPSPEPAGVIEGLKEGRALYDQGKYFDALGRYSGVLKAEAHNTLALHMACVSGEAMSLQAMRDDLVAHAAAPAPAHKPTR